VTTTDPPHLASAAAALARAEQAEAAVNAAIQSLHDAAPGEAFHAAWTHYEKQRATLALAIAECQVAVEEAHSHYVS